MHHLEKARQADVSDPHPVSAPSARHTRHRDGLRQAVVPIAVAAAIAGGFLGSGAVNGRAIAETQAGALGPSGSLLAPASPAFLIWTPLYAGLVAYAVWQLLPSQRRDPRHRAAGWWLAAVAALEGLWIVAAQLLPLWTTVVVMGLLVAAAYRAFRGAVVTRRGPSVLGALLLHGLAGAHLGWGLAAGVANAAAWIETLHLGGWAGDGGGVLALVGVCAAGIAVSARSGWTVAMPLAIAWAAAWIAVERLTGEPHNVPIAIAAIAAATLLAVVSVAMRVAMLRAGPIVAREEPGDRDARQ
ncbi:tryptophan-rich sensory protein [Microbacterium sp. Marseille-Q6965]|uniref:tryptophan-rich sensory protein n=1 Tax=Microbacterium sp. Marseille-Q6965 TaxID=2965072 RepID=UPI0021B7C6D3|nr:tryptophan-rich sensory protein [Microbacterium sp. Marseille-Q6965]